MQVRRTREEPGLALADIEHPDEHQLEARRTFKDFFAVGVAAKTRMAQRG